MKSVRGKVDLDSMTPEEVKEFVNSADYETLEEQLSVCSFATVKRAYTK